MGCSRFIKECCRFLWSRIWKLSMTKFIPAVCDVFFVNCAQKENFARVLLREYVEGARITLAFLLVAHHFQKDGIWTQNSWSNSERRIYFNFLAKFSQCPWRAWPHKQSCPQNYALVRCRNQKQQLQSRNKSKLPFKIWILNIHPLSVKAMKQLIIPHILTTSTLQYNF